MIARAPRRNRSTDAPLLKAMRVSVADCERANLPAAAASLKLGARRIQELTVALAELAQTIEAGTGETALAGSTRSARA